MPLHRVSVSLPVIDFVEKFSCKAQIPKVLLFIILDIKQSPIFPRKKKLGGGDGHMHICIFYFALLFLWGKIKNGLFLVYPVVIDCFEIGRYLPFSTSYKSNVPKG